MVTVITAEMPALQSQQHLVALGQQTSAGMSYEILTAESMRPCANLRPPAARRQPHTITTGGPQPTLLGMISPHGAKYHVYDAEQNHIGVIGPIKGGVLQRNWQAEQRGLAVFTGTPRGTRRIYNRFPIIPDRQLGESLLPLHFTFTAPGQAGFQIRRRGGVRERYLIDIESPAVDRRLVLAQLMALGAREHTPLSDQFIPKPWRLLK